MSFSSHDYAWAAGFLDGDGCFTLNRRRDKPGQNAEIHFGAVQVDRAPLDLLQQMFGGGVCRLGSTKKGTEIWQWRISASADIRRVVPMLLPYLKLKKRDAEIVLAYAETVRRRGRIKAGGTGLTEHETMLRLWLMSEMDFLRGR